MNRARFLAVLCVGGAAPAAPLDGPHALQPHEALQQLYGGEIWNDPRLSDYFNKSQVTGSARTRAYIEVAYETGFTEGGQEKVMVIARLTPEPPQEFTCHACAPLLGGAVFVRTGDAWKIESRTQILGFGNSGGTHFSLDLLGPQRHAVLVRLDDTHQGYEQQRINVIMALEGALVPVLSVGFDESPGADACAGGKPQSVHLEFKPGSDSTYFDALATIEKNDGDCGHLVPKLVHEHYRFQNGKYSLVPRAPTTP